MVNIQTMKRLYLNSLCHETHNLYVLAAFAAGGPVGPKPHET